ncbi:hypothetical protein ACFOSD_01480 [Salinispirillum marinum]|uniref:Uncharacterized protein n=2 Tax=Saccharospirillaceae TaxID=255527 RepID=A0ABV8B9M1_9GAMM
MRKTTRQLLVFLASIAALLVLFLVIDRRIGERSMSPVFFSQLPSTQALLTLYNG